MICGAIQAALIVSSIVFIQFMARIVVAEGSSVQVAVGLGAVLTAPAALALIVLCVYLLSLGFFDPAIVCRTSSERWMMICWK